MTVRGLVVAGTNLFLYVIEVIGRLDGTMVLIRWSQTEAHDAWFAAVCATTTAICRLPLWVAIASVQWQGPVPMAGNKGHQAPANISVSPAGTDSALHDRSSLQFFG